MTPFVAELLGTLLMILLGNGVVANVVLERTKGRGGGWIVITTGWALAVFVGVVVAGPFSGAHLNPAVTLGFALTGQFAWSAVPGYVAAQLIGAAAGAALVWLFYYAHLKATEDPAPKLDLFCTSPAIADRRFNFAGEMIATFVLIFSVFYISDGNLTLPDGRYDITGRPRLRGRAARRFHRVGDRSFVGRYHRLCHQSGPGSGPARDARIAADGDEREQPVELCVDSRSGAVVRSGGSRTAVFGNLNGEKYVP